MNRKLFIFLAGSLLSGSAWAAPSLTIGTGSGAAGTTVNVPITYDPTTASVAGIQFNLALPSGLSLVSFSTGSVVTAAGKQINMNQSGTTLTIIIFGINQTTIAA